MDTDTDPHATLEVDWLSFQRKQSHQLCNQRLNLEDGSKAAPKQYPATVY